MSSSLHVFRGVSEFRRMKVRAGTRLSSREGALSGSGPGPQPSLNFLATLLCGWGGFTGSRTSASTVLDENRRLLTATPTRSPRRSSCDELPQVVDQYIWILWIHLWRPRGHRPVHLDSAERHQTSTRYAERGGNNEGSGHGQSLTVSRKMARSAASSPSTSMRIDHDCPSLETPCASSRRSDIPASSECWTHSRWV